MLEALACVVLLALMAVPLLNIAVGLIAGYALFEVTGAVIGAIAGLVISRIWYDALNR